MIPVLVVVGALALDLAFGDPRSKYHPTAWIGTLIAKIVPLAKSQNPAAEKLGGIIVTISITSLVAALLFSFQVFTNFTDVLSTIILTMLGSILLKTTIAIHGLEKHGNLVMESISKNNLLNLTGVFLALIVSIVERRFAPAVPGINEVTEPRPVVRPDTSGRASSTLPMIRSAAPTALSAAASFLSARSAAFSFKSSIFCWIKVR